MSRIRSSEPILVVDDERAQRDVLTRHLSRRGYRVEAAATAEEALERLMAGSFAALITDLRLPGMDGLELVRRARELDEEMSVLLITAYASVDSAVEALRAGAHDYLLKPLVAEEVARKVGNLLAHRELLRENARLKRVLQQGAGGEAPVAGAAAMQEVMGWVRRAAATRSTVLITGETGTGKEVVARAVHQQGRHADQPFLAINVAAIPEHMVESELFGHERGAFTGAERRREGILRAAGEGTVLLDEIAELPLTAQAKLLRALEAHEVQPLGSDLAVPFEARLLAATHHDLEARVTDGRFRSDLFYRLNVLRIEVPPLRERREDIPGLVRNLLRRHAQRSALPDPVVSSEAMRALCAHPWRGNVRELSNVLERALILADEGRIELDTLPGDVREDREQSLTLQQAMTRFERAHISEVLRLCEGNRERAAAELGISPATLYRRIERHGLRGYAVRSGASGAQSGGASGAVRSGASGAQTGGASGAQTGGADRGSSSQP